MKNAFDVKSVVLRFLEQCMQAPVAVSTVWIVIMNVWPEAGNITRSVKGEPRNVRIGGHARAVIDYPQV